MNIEKCICVTDLATSRCKNWDWKNKTCDLDTQFLINKSTQTMATITITDKKAREIYPSASTDVKTLLEESFPKGFFAQKITERIKTFDDVIREAGHDHFKKEGPADEIAYAKLKIIAEVLNEGWTPNWDNDNERKWYPWFYMDSSRGFSFNAPVCANSRTGVGSRLCFKTEELCKFAATTFNDIYEAFFKL